MISKLTSKLNNKEQRLGNPRVNLKKCSQCGLCLTLCPGSVFEMKRDNVTVIRTEYCIKCGHCGSFCPSGAIVEESVERKKVPVWFRRACNLLSGSAPSGLGRSFRPE